jgi:mycothiol system anti-sigma-R factor
MDCKTARDLVPLYFDGELDRATARELEAHLDDCAECRDALVALDALRRAVREDAPRYAAPRELRARLQAELGEHRARPSRRKQRPWLALAASAALAFIAGGGAALLWQQRGETPIAHDLFESHWRALAATSPVDVISTDRHTVKPWFAGKLADAPLVQDFAEQGFALVGGRLDYAGSERVAVLVYRHGQHLIDVFVLPTSVGAAPAASLRDGYALDPVSLGGRPAAMVSDMDATERARFGALLAAAR